MGLWSISMMRSISSSPRDLVAGRHVHDGAIQLVIGMREQGVVHQRRLARAGNARDAGERPERKLGVHILEIVAARADARGWRASGRAGCAAPAARSSCGPERYLPVSEFAVLDDVVRRALRDDFAAVHAGPGPDVEHVVGGADGFLVVLDHQHGVAEVAQVLERA